MSNSRGARRARLNSRRRARSQRYGRFLGFTFLGSLIPGAGLVAAGKKRIGTVILFLLGLLVVAGLTVMVLVPRSRLASYAGDRQLMLIVGAGLAIGAIIWLVIALSTHRSLEPEGLSPGKRLGGALVVVVAVSLVVAPMSLGSRYAFTQRNLIGALSSSGESHTTPDIDEKDPWANKPRLNVLFLGSDAGEGREGIRPDSQIVASIDTKTGATTLISLPRNLQHFPFPDESPLAEIYPDGYGGPGDPLEYMLNAVWRNVPANHPEVFEGVSNPGADANKWAIEGALGIDIDYFLMVNLEGFEAVVDALGGITVDVPRDIPYGNKSLPGGGCTEANGYIEEGEDQHLDGFHALWFARSRCGSDDYDRMERQRCVMNAIVDKADPATLLSKYQKLAATAGDMITTDVPEGLFPALIELMLKVKNGSLQSLTLDNKFFESMGTTSADPDYDALHARIAEILEGQSAGGDTASTPPPDDTTEAGAQAGDADGTSGPSVQSQSTTTGTDTESTDVDPGEGDESSSEGTESSDEAEGDPDAPVDAGAVC